MSRTVKWWMVAASAVAVVGLAAGFGFAASDRDDQPLEGTQFEQASRVALEATGGGVVVDSEAGDGDAAFEIEIRRPDGSQVEVRLDSDFVVLGTEPDDDVPGESEDDTG